MAIERIESFVDFKRSVALLILLILIYSQGVNPFMLLNAVQKYAFDINAFLAISVREIFEQ